MLDNAEWLDGLNYLAFLRDIGRHFSVNRMLSFESVKSRLDRDQSLSFLEFNYMILQAYDFLELHRREGCLLQMGGSDQWGNIVNGIDLTRRVAGAEVFGLTSPLLTTSDGAKMGKTAGGAVWLNAEALAPYDFWQFWRNTADADVGRFLKLYTELPVDECDRLGALGGAEINAAKITLANEVTAPLPRRRGRRRRRGDRPRRLRGGRHRRGTAYLHVHGGQVPNGEHGATGLDRVRDLEQTCETPACRRKHSIGEQNAYRPSRSGYARHARWRRAAVARQEAARLGPLVG